MRPLITMTVLATTLATGLATLAGPAGAAAAPAARAGQHYPMSTLTVTGTDLAGKPDDSGLVVVGNADDSRRLDNPGETARPFRHGVARFSVPDGHYWAIAAFGTGVWRLVVLPQFTVSRATTVHTAARSATSKVTMVTPRPAQAAQTNVAFVRYGHSGPPGWQAFTTEGGSIYVSPDSHRPTVGTFRLYASQELGSPAGAGLRYQYALSYVDPAGLIPPQRYRVHPGDLATVHEAYYSGSAATAGTWSVSSLQPVLNVGVGPVRFPVAVPGRDVLYAGGNVTGMTWQTQYQAPSAGGSEYRGAVFLPPGRVLTGSWNRYPLHPDANAELAPRPWYDPEMPSATRSGNTLRLDTTPFSDNQPGDTGSGFAQLSGSKVTGSYQIEQDGRKVAAGNAVTAAAGAGELSVQAHLSSVPSVLRFTLTASRTGRGFAPPTASRTIWTWRSARESGGRLPRGWYCWLDAATGRQYRDCAVQPLLTLEYNVPRLNTGEAARPGPQVVTITAGHLQLAQAGGIAGVKVWASSDGGRSWRLARVTPLGGGRFRAAFTAPAGTLVALRTRAWDASGGTISETITGAYRILPDSGQEVDR